MQNGKHYDALTSLRGGAAWVVVLYHFLNYTPLDFHSTWMFKALSHGALAVDFFFILSGFVISLNYSEMFLNFNFNKLVYFITSRLSRIYPLHIFMLIVFLLFDLALEIRSKSTIFGNNLNLNYLIMSAFLIQNWGFSKSLGWNVPAWSISTEFFCYLSFPITEKILSTIITTRWAIAAGIAVTLAALASAFTLANANSLTENIVHLGLMRCFLEFITGSLLHKWIKINKEPSKNMQLIILATSSLFILFCTECELNDYIYAPIIFLAIIYAMTARNTLISKFLENRTLIHIGTISYSTYMCHYLLKQIVVLPVKSISTVNWLPFWVYCASVAAASIVMYPLIEVNSRKWIHKELDRLKLR